MDDQTRRLMHLQDDIFTIWQTDQYPSLLRVFAGGQRAIGETMIQEDANKDPECMGYGAFLSNLMPGNDKLIDAIRNDVASLDSELEQARPRLAALQRALIELLQFLDPNYVRFPSKNRQNV